MQSPLNGTETLNTKCMKLDLIDVGCTMDEMRIIGKACHLSSFFTAGRVAERWPLATRKDVRVIKRRLIRLSLAKRAERHSVFCNYEARCSKCFTIRSNSNNLTN